MGTNIFTFILLGFCIGFLLRRLFSKAEDKMLRKEIDGFINAIKTILKSDKNSVSAMEYDDRYTIVIKDTEDVGMIRLFKETKKLLVKDRYVQLTDKEYNNLLDTIKVVL